jgi:hypothetical protein
VYSVVEDCKVILGRNWTWGPSSLMIKQWTVYFDPEREVVVIMRV